MTDNFSLSVRLMDIVLKHCPDFDPFTVSEIVSKATFETNADKVLASRLNQDITILLTDHFGYADETSKNSLLIRLSSTGVKVKNAGGHFAYLKPQQDKEFADKERQNKTDTILDIDIKQKKFSFFSRWFPHITSAIALTFSILTYFKPEKKQQDLQPMQQQIKNIQQDVQRIDSVILADTTLK